MTPRRAVYRKDKAYSDVRKKVGESA